MKAVLAIVLCAIFGATSAVNDTELVYSFTNCILRAIDIGIDGLIPPHNPVLITTFNVNFTRSVLGVEYHFELTDNFLHNIMDLELQKVDVTSYSNPDALDINYKIYWPDMTFTGNFAWSAKIFGIETGGKGSYNILLDESDISGHFNLTKPGQEARGIKENVDAFTLDIHVPKVKADIKGAGPAWLSETVIEAAVWTALNNAPASIAETLRTVRFNGFWIGARIDTVMAWCAANPAGKVYV